MVEFSQIFTPTDVYRFFRERDKNFDFVLDASEVHASFISRYDKKEGAFAQKLEGFELMEARRFVWPGFFPPDRLASEREASHQWKALRERLVSQAGSHIGIDYLLSELSLALYASVLGGKLFSNAAGNLDVLDQIYFAEVKPAFFYWDFSRALRTWEEIVNDGGEEGWLSDVLAGSCCGITSPSEIQSLWRRVRKEGSVEQAMDFIGQLLEDNPRQIWNANSLFEANLEAFRLKWDYTWKENYPAVPIARQRSLIFASPFLMTSETAKAFIEYPLHVMIEQGYSDEEIASLFNVYRNKGTETMESLAEALIGLKNAGFSPFVRHQILKTVGACFKDEPARSALEGIARAQDGLARMRTHYAVGGNDQPVKDLLLHSLSKNREYPGAVIRLAGSLGYHSWDPSRIGTVIASLPELDGEHYYLELETLVQQFWEQHVYEGDLAHLFSNLGSRHHGREGSAVFVRKVREAYLLVEDSPSARRKSGISDSKRFQDFIEGDKHKN